MEASNKKIKAIVTQEASAEEAVAEIVEGSGEFGMPKGSAWP